MTEENDVQEIEQPTEPEVKEEKAKEEPDFKALYEAELGRRKRAEKDALKAKEVKEPEVKSPSKSKLDYGELAYLEVQGIKTDEEVEYLKKTMKVSGLELKDVVKDEYVQSQLKAIREKKVATEAIPSDTHRATPTHSGKDTPDYWIKKGELPDDTELRKKVVNEKIRLAKSGVNFPSAFPDYQKS